MDQTLTTVLMFGALSVGGYFLMIRPQQKRAKEQQDMIARLAEGSRVMLTSGVFATVRHLGTKQAVVEVSPGVELTILRQAIVRTVPADEEEFEYSDSDAVPDDIDGLDVGDVTDESPVDDGVAWQRGPGDDQSRPVATDDSPADPDQGADRR